MPDHRDEIVDQFTRQALPFSSAPAITNAAALQQIVALAAPGPEDTVLDVACGPGLVVCAFAPVVRRATGIDLTPAMLERGRALQEERGLANVEWKLGDVLPLPFADGSFSVVTSRLAFHHFPDPVAVLAEMRRVCASGGRILVADLTASEDPAKAAAMNAMERLRDPSHARALSLAELEGCFAAVGLRPLRRGSYRLENELEEWLARSFPAPGAADEVRRRIAGSIAGDELGLAPRDEGGRVVFSYLVSILVAER